MTLETGTITKSEIDVNAGSEEKTQIFQVQGAEDNDLQTVEELHIPGVQYRPPDESLTFFSKIFSAFKIAVGIDDKVPKLETLSPGERIAYASKDGAIVCSIWYKNDGTIAIVTDTDLTANVGGKATVTAATEIEFTAPLIKLTGKVECSDTLDVVGNIVSEADILADGDVVSDASATAISGKDHPHLGNMGVNTGPPLPGGGGTPPPASPPSTDANGDVITGNGNSVDTLQSDYDSHDHDFTYVAGGGSGTTDPPN